ncbi:MAG TPA: hypothetical protein VJV75_12515 [Candidatus Polarisedimenticolia bacterium]|nr:hypothetical protein [Candidatus Polarisedimenticolia bacterium]
MRPLTLTRHATSVLLATAALAGAARADILINPSGWRFPNIITSAKEAIKVSDRTPVIPGKETINRGYRKSDGTVFMTYEIEGKIFGVEVDEDGKPPFEFSIMDADGDGKFETKILHTPGNKDHAYVPQWVIDYYFSVHPEVKPGPGGTPVSPSLKTAIPGVATPPPAAKKPAVPLPPKERPNP